MNSPKPLASGHIMNALVPTRLQRCTGPRKILAAPLPRRRLSLSSCLPVNSSLLPLPHHQHHSLQRLQQTSTTTASTSTSATTAAAVETVETPNEHQQNNNWIRVAALGAGAALLFCCGMHAFGFNTSSTTTTTAVSSLPFAALSVAARSTPITANLTTEAIALAIKSAWAGLAAGCLHTLAGADHLAALTPLTIGRSHLQASLLGALWGFGHSTGQLILGLLMVVLKDRFTALVPALSKWGGTTVGLTLLAIGVMGIYESFFEQQPHEEAARDGASSVPSTSSSSPTVSSASDAFTGGVEVQAGGVLAAVRSPNNQRTFGLATFATGIVYGLQPDALFVIVPALALPTKLAATAYILMFVGGTVAAMGAYTGIIGATSAAIKKSNSGLTKKLSGFAACVAIVIGLGVLASGWGVDLPLPWLSGGGGGH